MSNQTMQDLEKNHLPSEEKSPQSSSFSAWRAVPVVLILSGLVAFFAFDLNQYLSFETFSEHRQALIEWTEANTLLAVLSFMGIYALAVAFSVPGAVWLTIIAGFLFGTLEATFYVVMGATFGATVIFIIAKYSAGDYLCSKASGMVKKMEDGFNENAFSYLLVLRLVPLFPFWLVNLAPAIVGCPLRTYVVATFIGIIPGTFVYAMVGNGLGSVFEVGGSPDLGIIFSPQILGPIVGLSLLAMIPVAYKKYKASKQDA